MPSAVKDSDTRVCPRMTQDGQPGERHLFAELDLRHLERGDLDSGDLGAVGSRVR